jgi:ubiquinone/menaquinone biosynthesis C-methylase UbiE
MKDQKQVWNEIAPEWDEFKTEPSEYIIKFLKKQKGKVLDLGSGSGRHLVSIKNGKMYLVDFSEKMIKLAKQRAKKMKIDAEFYVCDLTNLPFKDDFFDSAIMISSLHCIKGEKKREEAVKELFRVLKPKAKAEIGVWDKNSTRFKKSPKEKYVKWRDKGERYYYLFDEDEVHKLFEKNGFKIISTHNSGLMINFAVEKIIS